MTDKKSYSITKCYNSYKHNYTNGPKAFYSTLGS